MERDKVRTQLDLLFDDRPQGVDWLARLPLIDGERAATNLELLQEQLGNLDLLCAILAEALDSADPDAALNLLERLFDRVEREPLLAVLHHPAQRRQLLIVLGGSQFLANICCRHASHLPRLFSPQGIERTFSEEQMLTELRELIPESADFAELKAGLRRYKAQQILRIGSRDLCGLAPLEEVTAELSSLAAASLQRAYEVCDAQLAGEYGEPLEAPEGGARPPGRDDHSGDGEIRRGMS